MVREENLAIPILLGRPKRIEKTFERLDLNRGNTEIVDVEHDRRLEDYADEYYRLRHRKGITRDGARTATR